MFWDALSPADQEAIDAIGVRHRYERGSYLFMEGDPPTHVIVLLAGSLKLTRSTREGRSVLLEIRDEGDLIGEMGPIDVEPRSASAVAVTAIEALIVPADAFRRLLQERGAVAWVVITMLAARLRESSDRRLESGTSDSVTRLAGRLVELAMRSGPASRGPGDLQLDSDLTQQELAEWIGVSRDAIVLAFRQLRKLGLVETGRQQITILDIDALRRFAGLR